MKVPFQDFRAETRRQRDLLEGAFRRVLERGRFVLGPEVEAFERRLAAWLGTAHVVGVASGTEALALALLALGVTPGDEVVTTAFTAYPTITAIQQVGAVAVVIDVDPATGLLDPGRLEAAFTARTRAVVPVHLYGRSCDLDAILDLASARGVPVVEDCAQSIGATWAGRRTGTFGAAGCFSFYPTKNLGALGDAGAIATGSAELAASLARLRNYGQVDRYRHETRGLNSRLDEIQAAILSDRLDGLEAGNAARRRVASEYRARLDPAILLGSAGSDGSAVHHLFPVRVRDRDAFRRHLEARGIETLIHYPVPVHRQRAFDGRAAGQLGEAERLADEVVSLPMRPDLTPEEIDHVAGAVRSFRP